LEVTVALELSTLFRRTPGFCSDFRLQADRTIGPPKGGTPNGCVVEWPDSAAPVQISAFRRIGPRGPPECGAPNVYV